MFRLRRDDALMQLMLRFVSRFAREYGGPGKPPPDPDFFWGCDEYDALLHGLTRASREGVELVASIPDSEMQRGREGPFFLS